MKTKNTCLDCGKTITGYAIRCRSCANKEPIKIQKQRNKIQGKPSLRKGLSWEEIFGKEKATQMRKEHRKRLLENNPMQDTEKRKIISDKARKRGLKNQWKYKVEITCFTCGKKKKIDRSQLTHRNGKFCSHSCAAIWHMKNSQVKNTSIELRVEEYLEKLGIKYESQKVIPEGRTIADFYIPEQHIVLYADGEFWHKSNWAKEKGVVKRDNTQDLLLGIHGYNVLRLSESDIRNGKFIPILNKQLKGF